MKRFKKILFLIISSALFFVAGCYLWIESYQKFCYDKFEDLPHNKVGLVLGTTPKLVDGRGNLFFIYRIETAYELLNTGKVDSLLISGDNSRESYNEPKAMQEALMEKGVPEEKIILDYAGFRTLDSVIRAQKVFGQDEFTVISQPFHSQRAVYLARKNGIDAIGANAKDVPNRISLKVRIREVFARTIAVLDWIVGKQPKFLGDEIEIK